MMTINYNHIAEEYQRNRRARANVLRELAEGSGINSFSGVLEVGCGTGNYISAMHDEFGCRCIGVDPHERMLAYACLEAVPNLTFMTGRAEEIDFPDASFNFIFSVDVIHHLTARSAYFSHSCRQLRPGGTICTVTDSEEIIRNREPLSKYFPETIEVELGRYPRMDQLKNEMQAAGFTEVWETVSETPYDVTDLTPYREKAFSSLHLIPPEAHERGLAKMAEALAKGPLRGVARYSHLWGRC
jgi:ubiquinone/menaquinone biosynthesis C-methylase UbiE